MIDISIALKRLASLNDGTVRAAVAAAIFDGRQIAGLAVRDEQPEDVFLPILANPDAERRQALLAGCRDVCVRLFAALGELAAGSVPDEANLALAAEHFSALLSAARPTELHTQVRSLLEAALHPVVAASVRDPLVGLAVAYAAIDPRPEYWQDLLNGDIIPGHAFQALRRIDPRDPKLERFLAQLWRRVLRNELSLRLPFIVEAWAKLQVSPKEAVSNVLRETLSSAPNLREALCADCARYSHSANWVDWLSEPALVSATSVWPSDATSAPELIARIGEFKYAFGVENSEVIFPSERIDWLRTGGFHGSEYVQLIQSQSLIGVSTVYHFAVSVGEDAERKEFARQSIDRFTTNFFAQISSLQPAPSSKAHA